MSHEDEGDILKVRECQRLSANHQKLGEKHEQTFSHHTEETNPGTLHSWAFSLQNCELIQVCCFSPSVCHILLRQPEEINTVMNIYKTPDSV